MKILGEKNKIRKTIKSRFNLLNFIASKLLRRNEYMSVHEEAKANEKQIVKFCADSKPFSARLELCQNGIWLIVCLPPPLSPSSLVAGREEESNERSFQCKLSHRKSWNSNWKEKREREIFVCVKGYKLRRRRERAQKRFRIFQIPFSFLILTLFPFLTRQQYLVSKAKSFLENSLSLRWHSSDFVVMRSRGSDDNDDC